MNKVNPLFVDFLLKHGTEFVPALSSENILKGKVRRCFDMCALNVMLNDKFCYIEGIANPEGEWIYHGWISDGGRVAYDPTWKSFDKKEEVPPKWRYVGVPMNREFVLKFMMDTEYCGVFANAGKSILLAQGAIPQQFHELIRDSKYAL